MIKLEIHKNIVSIDKKLNEGYESFVGAFLIKYEEVKVPDPVASFGSYKKYKTVKELRQLYVEDDERIYFSYGLLYIIPPTEYEVVSADKPDLQTPSVSADEITHSLDCFDLRNDQMIAVRKCLANKRGIIQMPTATGKTAVIMSVIKQLQKVNPNLKVLALSPTLSTATGLNDSFVQNGLDSHVYGHPDKSLKDVNVALVQTLMTEGDTDMNLLNSINTVVYDECLPKGAMVLLDDYSEVPISEIYNDNEINSVLSFNLETQTYEPKRILHKYKTEYNNKFWRIKYRVPTMQSEGSLSLTPNHKVYIKNKGYTQASEIVVGDMLVYDVPELRGTVFQNKVECIVTDIFRGCGKKAEYKYNIEVEDNHNYFADGILVSNCHHLRCDTWNKLNLMLQNAEYSLGFSALCIDDNEIALNDIRQLSYESAKIIGSTGRVLLNMPPSYYIANHIIATPVIFRVHNYISVSNKFNQHDYPSALKMCAKSLARLMYISKMAEIFARHNYKTLILVSEKAYGFEIATQLVAHGVYSYGISYGSGEGYIYKSSHTVQKKGVTQYSIDYDKVNSLDVIEKLNNGDISVLIGTSHIDEGVDIKSLDAVIMAGSGKKDRRILQRVGRSLRKSKTGRYAYIVDFTDEGINILNKHSLDRLAIYKEVIGVSSDLIYNNIDFSSVEPIFKTLENIEENHHDSI